MTLSRLSLVPPRHPGPERIDDDGAVTEAEWERALREIAQVNRWLGGVGPLRRELRRFARASGRREVTLLDVGTGAADIPARLARALAKDGIALRAAACDLNPLVAGIAHRAGGASILRCDAFRLPFPDRSFDAVTASLFLHHFTEPEGARLLAEFHRVSAGRVIVNDLLRHRTAWLLIRAIAALGGASPLFRHDAPMSVLRGFTAAELRRMVGLAGLPAGGRVERCWAFRLILVLDRDAA